MEVGKWAIYHQINQYLDYCENVRKMSSATLCAKRSVYRRFVEAIHCNNLQNLTNIDFNLWVEHETKRGVSSRIINTYNANILAMVPRVEIIIPPSKSAKYWLMPIRPLL